MSGRSTKEREHRAFAVHELKAMDDNAGLFEGYVAVFSNLDGNGDIIDRGAFTKTIREAREVKERDKTPYILPLLWQHQEKDPIGGIIDAHEDDHGLYIRGQYDLDIEQGRRAYSGAKKGYLRGLSIGYDPVKSVWDQKHLRHLTEIRLWEGSPVTFPANQLAGITQVKNGEVPTESKDTTDDSETPPEPPTESPARKIARELKAQGPLDVIDTAAKCLDSMSDSEEGIVEALANACGLSLDGDDSSNLTVSQPVQALLAGIDGLQPAIKAVITAWQEWSAQCDALLVVLSIPDTDDDYTYAGYMGDARSALLELKAGRRISATTRKQLMGVVDGVMNHMETIKSIVGQGANQAEDDDEAASGEPNGKALERGTGQKPGDSTTSSSSTTEPDPSTLSEIEVMLLAQQLDMMTR